MQRPWTNRDAEVLGAVRKGRRLALNGGVQGLQLRGEMVGVRGRSFFLPHTPRGRGRGRGRV